jgi:hypothetical protein
MEMVNLIRPFFDVMVAVSGVGSCFVGLVVTAVDAT